MGIASFSRREELPREGPSDLGLFMRTVGGVRMARFFHRPEREEPMATYESLETTTAVELQFEHRCECCGHLAHGILRAEGVGIATANATSESAEDASLRRARWVAGNNLGRARLVVRCPACGKMNPSSLRKYQQGRYVVAAMIIAVFAPIAGVLGWAFAGHAIWAAVAGALVGSLLGLQPVLHARTPALPDVVFARPE